MENTNHHAGSATGIDLSRLEAYANESKAGDWHATEALTGMLTEDTVLALIALARATPQHSVTEQASEQLLAARAEGRAEAVEILTSLGAEGGIDDYIGWGTSGAPEDEGSAYWNVEKLRELFKVDDKLHNLFDRAESMYWQAKGEKDEAERMMRMVEQAPLFKPLHDYLANQQTPEAWDLMGSLARAQPLASTVATQPEHASIRTWQERCDITRKPVGKVESAMAAEIADLRAALAIPASTAASEQPERTVISYGSSVDNSAASEQQECNYFMPTGRICNKCGKIHQPESAASEQQAGADERRALFEREVLRLDIIDDEGLERRDSGEYIDECAQAAWGAWQAALTHRATTATPAVRGSDERAELMRAAEYLECYAKYLYEVKVEDIEQHPYIPSIEEAASELRAMLAAAPDTATTAATGTQGDLEEALACLLVEHTSLSTDGIDECVPVMVAVIPAAALPFAIVPTAGIDPALYERATGCQGTGKFVGDMPCPGCDACPDGATAKDQQGDTASELPAGSDPEFMKFMRADHKPIINNIWSISHVVVYHIWKAGYRAALAHRTIATVDQQADALRASVDAEYPMPDNPHTSVITRANDNRAAMWRGINAARAIFGQQGDTASASGVEWAASVGNMVNGRVAQQGAAQAQAGDAARDAARYRFVKSMSKETLLAWRGVYGCADEAVDAAMAAPATSNGSEA